MSERDRRVGRNEAVFREINEQIEGLNRAMAAISDETMHIVCECPDLICMERIVVPISEYEQVRLEPTLFLVKPGHEKPAVEDVVDQSAPTYRVVRKHPGDAAQVAKETDPRST